CRPGGYLVCEDGISRGLFPELPERFRGLPVLDRRDRLILPGLTDLHTHAPQFAFRGLGMDLELLEWLNARVYPEEEKYSDERYAKEAYKAMVRSLVKGPNTRACVFSTVHPQATLILMDLLEASGLVCMAGRVNMDRNCPPSLREESAAASLADTRRWLESCSGRYKNTYPILTPRFIPTCSDELMRGLGDIARELGLPLQSHLSENRSEVEWVAELCPGSVSYGDAYAGLGAFGGEIPTVMAHGVLSGKKEMELMKKNGVYLAHCPQSNANLRSGIAPLRRFLDSGVRIGLGSDVAGGCHSSIFRAMSDAVEVSKLRYCLAQEDPPVTVMEAFYLGTVGGGSFFGKAGSFEDGYEFDALVIDDRELMAPFELSLEERLARVIYFSQDHNITDKFVRGRDIL
ncbi:MAG: amidohydrolase family protein, partial [Oscillospiraceae bacterium]|nr:amidohydrolase family protein [Oscillospiraceae bacterium]